MTEMTDQRRPGALVLLGGATGLGGSVLAECARGDDDRPLFITYAHDRAGAEGLRDALGRGVVVKCDLGAHHPFDELTDALSREGLGVAALIHSAVRTVPGPLLDNVEELTACVEISALSLVAAVAALRPRLGTGASIVYLTSIGSSRVVPDYGGVGIAKAAGEAVVRYLAHELGPIGVRVNALGSGPAATKALTAMFGDKAARMVDGIRRRSPLHPPADETSVARMAAFLVWGDTGTTGQVLSVDGGLFLA